MAGRAWYCAAILAMIFTIGPGHPSWLRLVACSVSLAFFTAGAYIDALHTDDPAAPKLPRSKNGPRNHVE